MKIVSNIEHWSEAHHPKWLDIIRIFLGLVLVIKGILFIRDNNLMVDLLLDSSAQLRSFVLIHYIIGIQIVAGLMITFGLLTRVAALLQIPILIAALFYTDISEKFNLISSELPYLILVLMLLVFFFINGAGPISADYYLRKQSE